MCNQTIYQLLSNYTKEEIEFVISKLNNHDKSLIYLRYGSNLENPDYRNWKKEYIYQFYGKLLPKMKRFLKSIREGKTLAQGGKIIKTIYQEFNDYEKEDIDYVISLLPDDDKQVLYLRYGYDFSNPDTSNWDSKYLNKLFDIKEKIRIRLKHLEEGYEVTFKINGLSTIYQILNKYTKEEIDLVLENLSIEDKHLLWLRYGDDLNNPVRNPNWKRDDNISFYKKLLPRIRTKLEKNRQMLKGQKETIEIDSNNPYLLKIVKETLEKLKDENYRNALEKYTIKEILSYVLIQKMDDTYNIKDIMRYFGLDRKMIISMASKVLHNMIPEEKDKVKTKTVN